VSSLRQRQLGVAIEERREKRADKSGIIIDGRGIDRGRGGRQKETREDNGREVSCNCLLLVLPCHC